MLECIVINEGEVIVKVNVGGEWFRRFVFDR